MTSKNKNEVGLLSVFTLVLWLVCFFVGLTGLLQDGHPLPATQPTTLAAETLDVEIASEILAPEADAPPALPQPSSIAEPSPAIAFAAPAEIPVRPEAARALNPVQLTFGEGEGRQPAPEYPIEAAIARQQGTVVVIFSVGEDGQVTNAKVSSASPWPMLNQSALRTIRLSWRFPAGRVRSYQVAIQFVLNN
jgi:protein TonB